MAGVTLYPCITFKYSCPLNPQFRLITTLFVVVVFALIHCDGDYDYNDDNDYNDDCVDHKDPLAAVSALICISSDLCVNGEQKHRC